MPNPNTEDVVVSRVTDELNVLSPGFDPAMITTLISLLTDLFTNFCGGKTTQLTPEQAVARVKNMSRFEQSMLISRLKKKAQEDGVKDAKRLTPLAVVAVKNVAAKATPEEQVAFAAYLLPIVNNEFEMI